MTGPSGPGESAGWDLEVRPHLMPRLAYVAAGLIAVAHILFALLLKVKSSGVIFRTSDQVAIAVLGLIIAGAVLLFTRPRLRVGAAGLSVRNVLGDRLIPWPQVVGVSFPAGKRWARLDLPDDEYLPLVAIQSADKGRAVAAIEAVRALVGRYQSGA
ncbi:MAG: PH domain-containing protein [Mycobacterium sp.]